MSEVIKPPNRLAENAVKGRGPDLKTIKDRVQSGVEAMVEEYEKELSGEFSLLTQSLAAMKTEPGSTQSDAMASLYRVAHDARGMAGSFGYPLLAAIATSLCSFIDRVGEEANRYLDVIGCHVEAMLAVYAGRVRGDGGRQGKELIESIGVLVAKSEGRS